MPSFSMNLKNELASLNSSDDLNLGLLKGLLQVNGSINLSSTGLFLEFKTKNELVAQKLIDLIKQYYKVDSVLIKTKEVRLNKDDIYLVRLFQNANYVIRDLKIMQAKDDTSYSLKKDLISEDMKTGYLRGAFLSAGSINDPKTMIYHLEIQTFNTIEAVNLRDLMNTYNLSAKISKNRRGFVVYMKSAEKIANFIKIVGGTDSLFYFENIRIEKDLTNSINRVMNCEIANQKKTTEASMRQIEEIKMVESFYQTNLPKSIQEAITLRKENPEDSLSELSQKAEKRIGKKISKSALNHRFRAMHDLFLSLPKK